MGLDIKMKSDENTNFNVQMTCVSSIVRMSLYNHFLGFWYSVILFFTRVDGKKYTEKYTGSQSLQKIQFHINMNNNTTKPK